MVKPLIVWDFDDVLFPLTQAWFQTSGRDIQSTLSSYAEIKVNPPHEIMGISKTTYLESLDAFRNSDEALSIPPRREIQNWFAVYGRSYRNEILTARPLHTLDAAKAWINKHLPSYFQGFGFVPAPRPGVDISGYPESKRKYLEQSGLHPDYFIDDNLATVQDVNHLQGVRGIVYPAPWNGALDQSFDPKKLMDG